MQTNGHLKPEDNLFAKIAQPQAAETYNVLADEIAIDPEQEAEAERIAQDWPNLKIPDLPGVRTVRQPDLSAGQWLTDYTNYAHQCSPMSPEIYHEAIGLWLLSTAVARRVVLRVSGGDIHPNLFMLLIGPPGLVRKTSAMKVAERVADEADVLLLPSLGTTEALSVELAYDRQPKNLEKNTKDYQRWLGERALAAQRGLLLDEASGLFDAGKKDYMAELRPLLLRWYDCPDKLTFTQTVSRGRSIIDDSYLALAGATTPGAMRRYFGKKSVEWEDGTWSRFNLITYETLPDFKFFGGERIEPPRRLVERLRFLYASALKIPEVIEIPEEKDDDGNVIIKAHLAVTPLEVVSVTIDPAAWTSWESYAAALHSVAVHSHRNGGKKLSPLYTRQHFHTIKIAILLATADWADAGGKGPLRVELRHWERAQWISERWRASVHRVDSLVSQASDDGPSTPQVETDAQSLLNLVQRKQSIKNRDITQHTSRWGGEKQKRVDAALNLLLAQGKIRHDETTKKYSVT